MKAYRIAKSKYAQDLSGKGAERFGGRWNNKGTPALYASEHRSLCVLELLVHTSLDMIPTNLVLLELQIPDEALITGITSSQLPVSWYHFPHDDFTRQMGDEILNAGDSLAIRVPSAVVEEERNIVINPRHDLAGNVSIQNIRPLELDTRFFG